MHPHSNFPTLPAFTSRPVNGTTWDYSVSAPKWSWATASESFTSWALGEGWKKDRAEAVHHQWRRDEEREKSSMMGCLRCDERERLIKGMILAAGWCRTVLFSLKKKSKMFLWTRNSLNDVMTMTVITTSCLTVQLSVEELLKKLSSDINQHGDLRPWYSISVKTSKSQSS